MPATRSWTARCAALFSASSAARRHPHSFPTRRSSDLLHAVRADELLEGVHLLGRAGELEDDRIGTEVGDARDRKSTRLNSSHLGKSYAVFCLKKKSPGDAVLVAEAYAADGGRAAQHDR